MSASFDVYDRNSWYFEKISRQDATDLLMREREGGVFLIRDSATIIGDYVLCVREDSKVSHYIINKIQQNDKIMYRIGDQSFPDLPNLLAFYKLHYLDTTPLRRPAIRRLERVVAKFDFEGSDQDDLPFKKGEILYIISKDEEQWYTARNESGKTGQIPVPYVQRYEDCKMIETETGHSMIGHDIKRPMPTQRILPAMAIVKQARVPNAYDKTALKLEKGDLIKVTKTNINGQWEGELRGKVGHFPFTHVEFIENDNHHSTFDE